VSIVFSEAMDKESVVAAMGITAGAALGDFRWPNDATVDAMTVIPMEYHASYTVYVLTSATDLAGNPLHEPDEIAFTTAPWTKPGRAPRSFTWSRQNPSRRRSRTAYVYS